MNSRELEREIASESCPYKEALHENTGNNWTDSCSESETSSHVTIT